MGPGGPRLHMKLGFPLWSQPRWVLEDVSRYTRLSPDWVPP